MILLKIFRFFSLFKKKKRHTKDLTETLEILWHCQQVLIKNDFFNMFFEAMHDN